jgi:septum formation protein
MQHLHQRNIVLGSTSVYRRELLARLRLPFSVVPSHFDESPLAGESPAALAARLALGKAHEVAKLHPQSVVIGCDQVADLHGTALGKPGNFERAMQQLQAMRGQTVLFQTAVAVVCLENGFCEQVLVPVAVKFRSLSDLEITNYLLLEEPYDCAGSAKSEGLGIALLESIESDDPTTLIGLPLIRTSAMLRAAGISLLGAP